VRSKHMRIQTKDRVKKCTLTICVALAVSHCAVRFSPPSPALASTGIFGLSQTWVVSMIDPSSKQLSNTRRRFTKQENYILASFSLSELL